MWLAGGGVRDGAAVGTADDFGFSPVEKPVHVHVLNASVCTCSGWITRSSPASTFSRGWAIRQPTSAKKEAQVLPGEEAVE